jgi:Flp pilus assembly secretin CpaC
VLDDHTIHLTCRIKVSEYDTTNGITIAGKAPPILKAMNVDTAGNYQSGQTIVLSGPRQQRYSSVPLMPDSSTDAAPNATGSPKTQEVAEEIETLVLLTPEIVKPMLSERPVKSQTR